MPLLEQVVALMSKSEALAEEIKALRKSLPQGDTSAAEIVRNLALAQQHAETATDRMVRVLADLEPG